MRHPDHQVDQNQKMNPANDLADLQNKFNALRDQVEVKFPATDDQNEQEEQLEELQVQLRATQEQVHLQAETIQSFHSL